MSYDDEEDVHNEFAMSDDDTDDMDMPEEIEEYEEEDPDDRYH